MKANAPAPEVSLAAPEFDLALTLGSGQVFHWLPHGRGFAGTIGQTPVYVEQCGGVLRTNAAPALISRYFALDHPLREICRTFPDDVRMENARAFCHGLRIIRQPAWECLATFITSSMKQVAHIAQISHAIRRRFGTPVHWPGGPRLFAYPAAARLAEYADERSLRECALGYRAINLLKTARLIAGGKVDLEAIHTMSDADARAELLRLPGVGEKVANCVLLFACERVRAFPIDVWIGRVLRENYFAGKAGVTDRELREFSATYFGEFGGYAQQYLFHHARSLRQRRQRGAQRHSTEEP